MVGNFGLGLTEFKTSRPYQTDPRVGISLVGRRGGRRKKGSLRVRPRTFEHFPSKAAYPRTLLKF